jgi:pimeloyl-ACP methyl ester carboxylesterase
MLDRHGVQHRRADIQGLSAFYREAGDPTSPKLLLLGGFPTSHQFRNLIPALADRFHVLSLDDPGFGNTAMRTFDYTFDAHHALRRRQSQWLPGVTTADLTESIR